MMWFKRRQKNATEEYPSLTVPTSAGEALWTFPGEVIDSLRHMVTRMSRGGNLPARISMVSALHEEGVTYLSRAMSAVIAHDLGVKICLIDLNWWAPAHYPAGMENKGLAEVMAGEMVLEEAIFSTGWPNFSLLPAGFVERAQRPTLARNQALKEMINELNSRFDHLILDIPAILSTSDAVPLAALGTTCCFVIRQGITHLEDVRKALDEIEHLPVSGVVMNRVKHSTPRMLMKLLIAA